MLPGWVGSVAQAGSTWETGIGFLHKGADLRHRTEIADEPPHDRSSPR
jgi:hypothetical protein